MRRELADPETSRQLAICDACRFCEGICAVFPALERRGWRFDGDVVHLAHLCHDCGACLAVCPYAPPHTFGVNVPQLLAARRVDTVRSLGAKAIPTPPDRRRGLTVVLAFLGALVAVVLGVVLTHDRLDVALPAGSPFRVIDKGYLIVGSALVTAATVLLLAIAGHRYWRAIGRRTRDLGDLGSVARGLGDAATLRNLDGGGVPCGSGATSGTRRRLIHQLLVVGFGLTVVATIAAAVNGELLGHPPPYRWWSVPVLTGAIGGLLLLSGCIGFRVLGAHRDPAAVDPESQLRNRALLDALATLAVTGLAALVLRDSRFGAAALVVHIVAVWSTILIAAGSKFAHAEYRLLALISERVERDRTPSAPSGR